MYLNQEIRKFLSDSQKKRIWDIETVANPYPYKQMLSALSVELSIGKGIISVEETTLVLSGGKRFLLNFVDNLPYDVEDPKSGISYHIHYDSISFGDILSKESMEIILTKKRDTDNKSTM